MDLPKLPRAPGMRGWMDAGIAVREDEVHYPTPTSVSPRLSPLPPPPQSACCLAPQSTPPVAVTAMAACRDGVRGGVSPLPGPYLTGSNRPLLPSVCPSVLALRSRGSVLNRRTDTLAQPETLRVLGELGVQGSIKGFVECQSNYLYLISRTDLYKSEEVGKG